MQQDERGRRQREAIRDEAARRNIRIIPRGRAFELRGPGIDMMCCDLAMLTEADLAPAIPRDAKQARA